MSTGMSVCGVWCVGCGGGGGGVGGGWGWYTTDHLTLGGCVHVVVEHKWVIFLYVNTGYTICNIKLLYI